MSGPRTLVSFHAHPDDEALLTGGTLSRAAAAGHRVVIVVATSGEAGLAEGSEGSLESHRIRELREAAQAIGAARVELLGYADSGFDPTGSGARGPAAAFSELDPEEPAARLASLLVDEQADVLTSYDPAGGYGHPDHVQVHHVARRAAALAETPVLLEATLPRQSLTRVAGALRLLTWWLPVPAVPDLTAAYTDRAQLTHRIDVRAHLDAKLAALRCHASQATGDDGRRTVALLLSLPRWLQQRVLGYEWFRQPGLAAPERLLDDVFGSLSG